MTANSRNYGICELCGSDRGIKKKPVEPLVYGDVHDVARSVVPYAVKCICKDCANILVKYEEKKKVMIAERNKFAKSEYARRHDNNLCLSCGGIIERSNPVRIYEGTYETTERCTHCGKTEHYT